MNEGNFDTLIFTQNFYSKKFVEILDLYCAKTKARSGSVMNYFKSGNLKSSLVDTDPHVFGPSGSVCQRYGSGSFPFLIKVVSGLK